MDRPFPPDVSNLPRFIRHLEPRDAQASELARRLWDEGWTVQVFWGPEQMDVWQLVLRRNDWCVKFGVERGFSDGVGVSPFSGQLPGWDDWRPISWAIFAWAVSNDIGLDIEPAGGVFELQLDIASHGHAALDWLAEGNGEALVRMHSVWLTHRDAEYALIKSSNGKPDESERQSLRAEFLSAIAAAGSHRS